MSGLQESPMIVLGGRYELLAEIGRGGLAQVHEGAARGPHGFVRRVAVKRLRPEFADDSTTVRMFLDEARIASGLHHGGIVSVLDFGVEDAGAYQVLELVDGWDAARLLERALEARTRIPIAVALHLATEVARALAYAHGASRDGVPLGIVHRDVKPSNVLVSRTGDVKLGDFGIALARERIAQTTGFVVRGTEAFMSPEQLLGLAVDVRTDVFSLGCTLHALLAFVSPSERVEARIAMTRGRELELDPSLPVDVVPILRRALAANPANRFASAHDMAEALGALLVKNLHKDGKATLVEWLGKLDAPLTEDRPIATREPSAPPPDGEPRFGPGQTFGRYIVEDFVARGGVGDVFRARDTTLGRTVALKVLRPDRSDRRPVAGRFEREAKVIAALSHPNIVVLHDGGEIDDCRFLAMEWLEGAPLSQLVSTAVPLGARIQILVELADALAYAHERGVIHRDVKPSNVMIDRDHRAKLVDFGIARRLEPSATSFRTRHGAVLGTPSYMAPEQFASAEVTPAADQFSWSVLAFRLLSGVHPGQALPTFRVADPHPSQVKLPILTDVVARAMSIDPAHRFPSMRAVTEACRAAIAGERLATPAASPEPAAARPAPKATSPWRGVLPLSLIAIPFVVLAAYALTRESKAERPATPSLPASADPAIPILMARAFEVQSVSPIAEPRGRALHARRAEQVATFRIGIPAEEAETDQRRAREARTDVHYVKARRGPILAEAEIWGPSPGPDIAELVGELADFEAKRTDHEAPAPRPRAAVPKSRRPAAVIAPVGY